MMLSADHAQRLAKPGYGLRDLGRREHAVSDALDRCGRLAEAHHAPDPAAGLAGRVVLVAGDLDRFHALLSGDHFDLVAIGLGEAHAPAAARLVNCLDARGAGQPGEALEIVLVGRVVGEADELRTALVHDMKVMMIVGTAHVECSRCALGADQSEMGKELLHLIEIGRFHPGPGKFRSLDYGHCFLRSLEER